MSASATLSALQPSLHNAHWEFVVSRVHDDESREEWSLLGKDCVEARGAVSLEEGFGVGQSGIRAHPLVSPKASREKIVVDTVGIALGVHGQEKSRTPTYPSLFPPSSAQGGRKEFFLSSFHIFLNTYLWETPACCRGLVLLHLMVMVGNQFLQRRSSAKTVPCGNLGQKIQEKNTTTYINSKPLQIVNSEVRTRDDDEPVAKKVSSEKMLRR